jgi:hypothetical protein
VHYIGNAVEAQRAVYFKSLNNKKYCSQWPMNDESNRLYFIIVAFHFQFKN